MKTQILPRRARGFTLVELLVVIAILAILASATFMMSSKFIDKGRKVQAMSQFKDLENGLTMYATDFNRPLLPMEKRSTGEDAVFGEAPGIGKDYSNGLIVAVLAGEASDLPYTSSYDIRDYNPRGETVLKLPYSAKNKNGVGRDGNLYDPWGRQILIAINAFKSTNPSDVLQDNNEESPGTNDSHLETYGYGKYKETAPRDQPFVFWSYGTDGKKGNGAKNPKDVVGYTKTDDVISW
ncbi:MAG: type II secretion system protein [Luteolibacter sp.]